MRKQGFISQKIGDKAGKMPILGWIKKLKNKNINKSYNSIR